MDDQTTARRTFLKQASLGLAAPVLAQLFAVRRVFAGELPETGAAISGEPFSRLRDAYSLSPEVTYFNHASIGTIPRAVQKARQGYLEVCETNPWLHMWGGAWEEPREEVRRKASALLHCRPDEVAFTHNTTETFNLLAQGLPLGRGDEVVFSSLNHTGASACWHHHAETRGYRVRSFDFPVLEVPRMTKDDVLAVYDSAISRRTRALVVPHVDNVVGLLHPVSDLSRLARSRGVEFVAVDAAQTVGMLPVDAGAMGVDVVASSPHKWLQAPKGLGLAYVRREIQDVLRPMWVTWGQERWRGTARVFEDYGTRNLPEVLALGDAIDFQQKLGETVKAEHHRKLRERVRAAVEASPKLAWRSPESWELSAALYAVEVRGEKSQDVFQKLYREHGFVVRPFSTGELETVRLSPNVANTVDDVERFFDRLARADHRRQAHASGRIGDRPTGWSAGARGRVR